MSRFVFSLRSLLQYRKSRRDLCRQLLAQILLDDSRLVAEKLRLARQRDRQLAEFRELSAQGKVQVDAAAMRRYHSVQLLGSLLEVEERRNLVAQQIHFCREALTRADADVKVLERLEETQRAAHEYVEQRADQREREEIWMAGRLGEALR